MASTSSPGGSLPAALRPPAGLVLGIGVVLSVLPYLVPSMAAYAEGLYCLVPLTVICWGLLALGQTGARAQLLPTLGPGSSQDLQTVHQMRNDMHSRLQALPADSPLRRDFPEILQRLDQEIIPQLTSLISKNQVLGQRIDLYDRTAVAYRPDAPTLDRLRDLAKRQAFAIQGLVKQVVTMDAALLGLIQEGSEQQVVGQVREWAEEMDLRWKTLAEVLADDTPGGPR